MGKKLSKKSQAEHRLTPDVISFLKSAGKQKKVEWLEKNKETYESVLRLPFIALAEQIKHELAPLAPGYHFPSKGLARIRRPEFKVKSGLDLYKDWVSMMASKPSLSRFESNPHLFFGLFANEEDQILVAAGLWQPSSRQMRLVRELIRQKPEVLEALFKDRRFKARFKNGFYSQEMSAKVPRGFPVDHPHADWLRLKKYVVMNAYKVKDLKKSDFHQQVIEDLKQGLRLNQILEQAISSQFLYE